MCKVATTAATSLAELGTWVEEGDREQQVQQGLLKKKTRKTNLSDSVSMNPCIDRFFFFFAIYFQIPSTTTFIIMFCLETLL